MRLWKFGDPVDFGEGYRELEDGEIVPKGAETFMGKKWVPVDGAVGASYKRARKGRARYHFPIRVNLNPGDGYRLLEEGDLFPHGYEYLSTYNGEWELGELVGNRYRAKTHGTCRAKMPAHKGLSKEASHSMLDELVVEQAATYARGAVVMSTKETTESPNWTARMEISTDLPKDPKTKYHRPMYPAWNDTEVHTDANGHKYLNVDVYSVLAAFDPGHEVAHAVKKLLAAGTRDKGPKIQDYREAIISIEAAIYRAEIEGGAG